MNIVEQLATTQNPKLAPIHTIRGNIQHRLYSMGLFEEDVLLISANFETAPGNEPMQGRWESKTEDYPPMILTINWSLAKRHAATWLKEHKPQHWALAVFET